MKCSEIMTRSPEVCTPKDNAATAAQIMRRKNVGAVPVVTDLVHKKLVGIVTDRDLTLQIDAKAGDAYYTPVKQVMTRALVTCAPEDDCYRAVEKMAEHQIRRIPIVNDDRQLLGIISQSDIALHLADAQAVAAMVGRISRSVDIPQREAAPASRGA